MRVSFNLKLQEARLAKQLSTLTLAGLTGIPVGRLRGIEFHGVPATQKELEVLSQVLEVTLTEW